MGVSCKKERSKFIIALLLTFLALGRQAYSQLSVLHSYTQFKNIKVYNSSPDTLKFPFAGGLNSCQFNTIDLNLDGLIDLLVFDRHGNRLLPFCANPALQGSYLLIPELVEKLPVINQWVNFIDYNNDGKVDIFTYTTGGIKVYKNTSETELKFSQITFPYLLSQQGNVLTNILVTGVDYPAIADLDKDGDMDILTFWGLGSFVEWHKNFSMELYNHSDSLVFSRVTTCWGEFAEGNEDNLIKLDTCVGSKKSTITNTEGDPKHTGSTMLIQDINSDSLPDLILGDVDFNTLTQLINGGSLAEAKMISYNSDFPNANHPVELNSFPLAKLVDVDGDNVRDLLVSPFEPSLSKSENAKSIWYYHNAGSEVFPEFVFQKENFLQDEMLDFGSGAYPVVCDYNLDGLQDIIIGNYGYFDSSYYDITLGRKSYFHSSLALLINTGDLQQPEFTLIDYNIANLDTLSMLALTPAFADMDNDGDWDLVCGNSKGQFVYCENIASNGENAHFELRDKEWFGLDIGEYSAPAFFDFNNDGLIDLISGNKNGTLTYFQNQGNKQNPDFSTPVSDFGKVDVTDPQQSNNGYSIPLFLKEKHGSTILLVSSEYGDVFVYDNISSDITGEFQLKGKLPLKYEGIRVGVGVGNFNSDTLADIVIGNFSGGLNILKGTQGQIFGKPSHIMEKITFLKIAPIPFDNVLHIDCTPGIMISDNVLIIRSSDGKIIHIMKNVEFPVNIDFSNNKPGLYFISYSDGIRQETLKAIKLN